MAMSRGPCDLLELQNQARVEGVPPVPRREVQKLLKKQNSRRIIEKDVPRVGRKKEVAAQERKNVATEEDVHEICLPMYDDMGLLDYGLDRF